MADDRNIRAGDPGYPTLLELIPGPPASLNIRGKFLEQDQISVAVVGSRNPTPYGLEMARSISGGLAAHGVTVVSGLARGIDTKAHKAALDRNGRTVAVLGCGLDIDYPRGSGELRKAIAGNGVLVSEFDPDTPPLPRNFPSRNRIISGLSLAVVVIQAGINSGSLITARWALDQGREVFAVPGRANEILSEGPLALIRDGAAPACSAGDIIELLDISAAEKKPDDPDAVADDRESLASALQSGPLLPEELAQSTGLPLPETLSELMRLELEGCVVQVPGGRFTLK